MLARVVQAPLANGTTEAAVRLYHETILPSLRTRPGFCGALFLTDRSTGRAASLTLWDETTMEVDPALFRTHLAAFESLVSGAFVVEHYEASVEAFLAAPAPAPPRRVRSGYPHDAHRWNRPQPDVRRRRGM